jgi:hypothetical protein
MIYDDEIKKIVLARLSNIPENHKISVGSKGDYTVEEMRSHVEKEDEVGRMFIEMQLLFIRSMKKGLIRGM